MSEYKEIYIDSPFCQPRSRVFCRGECIMMVSPPTGKCGWHISISCANRNPTWEEIRDAWYTLVPESDRRNGAMFFPPKDEYVNLHQHCFHVHEVPINLKEMFKDE